MLRPRPCVTDCTIIVHSTIRGVHPHLSQERLKYLSCLLSPQPVVRFRRKAEDLFGCAVLITVADNSARRRLFGSINSL